MERIAFYGKGGIGKSTVAANVSAILAKKGKRVLHIGCDPKADSTRTLLSKKISSVLEILEEKEMLQRKDIVHLGKYGVQCVECGGPEAGCGCAGLGITTAIEELERLGIFREKWDVVVYDVLGDVVCGGFSVPMRKHYVDRIFVVTSAEYMSLYAANNILKGVKRYSQEESLFGGLILNHIKNKKEEEAVRIFAQRTGTYICALLEESMEMKKADFGGVLFTEIFHQGKNTEALKKFTEKLLEGACERTIPISMSAEEIEVFGKEIYERILN